MATTVEAILTWVPVSSTSVLYSDNCQADYPERSVTIVHQLRASVRKRGDDAGERRFVGGDELYRDHVCVNRLEPIYRLVMHTKKCG
ncbi:hypothetical protein PF005_g28297 [Phytophthora fragariae]|uniref:Uncharacterized protein n=1 Tax=Phytophthora fragariae TaxID=53985 RepID=A0A6A3W836_9STRA|nr:hypothetical protein PF011_g27318 [Phytophthora fragariae]KAE9068345.1 hypothetical protein PF010_g27096 [Phytophthora fragariae]KAE9077716.1 hypothetical protein PF006_g27867 [Phytophthora fragariae]KAE9168619.1 hypothetical protein PF005_g28297 [Phytophthora fragariae]KAE9172178.1 hypothetical protein PF004_g27342 [Phytophthora fragariae]